MTFEYWFSIRYRKVALWIVIVLFLTGAGLLLYYRDYLQSSLEQSLAEQRAPKTDKPVRFVEIHGTVLVKKVGKLNWVSAENVDGLQAGDLIQTQRDSTAKVAFFDGSVSALAPDSLTYIVESHETQNQVRSVAVEVSSGQIDLSTGKKNNPQDKASLMTPEAEAKLQEFSEAQATYDRDKRESGFYVFSGGAEVATREAEPKRFDLGEQQGLTLQGKAEQVKSFTIPNSPRLIAPENASVFISTGRSRLELKWEPVEGIQTYQVKVSQAGNLAQPVLQERVKNSSYVLPKLTDGIYYWEVQSVGADGVTSKSNQVFKFAVDSQSSRPRRNVEIRVQIDKVIKIGDIYEVIGRTDPGISLEINGEFVQVEGNGNFKHFTSPAASRGDQLHIRAKDLSGLTRSFTHPVRSSAPGGSR
ncbi:MAG: FecR domain-containing protein [Acidobacteria bacterium]|nr:FecR domain-containing protein [Acidobacteriota bacterium]